MVINRTDRIFTGSSAKSASFPKPRIPLNTESGKKPEILDNQEMTSIDVLRMEPKGIKDMMKKIKAAAGSKK